MFRKLLGYRKNKKVLVIGLDCAPPELVFDEFVDDMPNIRRLMENGVYGKLESTIPAIIGSGIDLTLFSAVPTDSGLGTSSI